MKKGLWHGVLKDKYFPSTPVVAWLRCPSVRTHNVSNTWRCLLKSLEVIKQGLAWNPGSGHTIRLREDVVLGLGRKSLLSAKLLTTLKQRGIHYMYQAKGPGGLKQC
jgi:hypothetical protein